MFAFFVGLTSARQHKCSKDVNVKMSGKWRLTVHLLIKMLQTFIILFYSHLL